MFIKNFIGDRFDRLEITEVSRKGQWQTRWRCSKWEKEQHEQ